MIFDIDISTDNDYHDIDIDTSININYMMVSLIDTDYDRQFFLFFVFCRLSGYKTLINDTWLL